MNVSRTYPHLGFGLGLRVPHYETILETRPKVDWFEVLSENYMVAGGKPLHYLDRIRGRYPVVMHGVSLSIGSADPLNSDYLKQLKALADRIEPHWISDHLCWTGVGRKNLHDLMPLPYTEEAIEHVVGAGAELEETVHDPQRLADRRRARVRPEPACPVLFPLPPCSPPRRSAMPSRRVS